jgi:hypothetical protein
MLRSRVQAALAGVGLQNWGAVVGWVIGGCLVFALLCFAVALALWAFTWVQAAWSAVV